MGGVLLTEESTSQCELSVFITGSFCVVDPFDPRIDTECWALTRQRQCIYRRGYISLSRHGDKSITWTCLGLVWSEFKVISVSLCPWSQDSLINELQVSWKNHPFISTFNFIFIELGSTKLKFFTFSSYF